MSFPVENSAINQNSFSEPIPRIEKLRYFAFDVTVEFAKNIATKECSFQSVIAKICILAFPIIAALETCFELFLTPFILISNCCSDDQTHTAT